MVGKNADPGDPQQAMPAVLIPATQKTIHAFSRPRKSTPRHRQNPAATAQNTPAHAPKPPPTPKTTLRPPTHRDIKTQHHPRHPRHRTSDKPGHHARTSRSRPPGTRNPNRPPGTGHRTTQPKPTQPNTQTPGNTGHRAPAFPHHPQTPPHPGTPPPWTTAPRSARGRIRRAWSWSALVLVLGGSGAGGNHPLPFSSSTTSRPGAFRRHHKPRPGQPRHPAPTEVRVKQVRTRQKRKCRFLPGAALRKVRFAGVPAQCRPAGPRGTRGVQGF